MQEKVLLDNRYEDKNYLVPIGNRKYKLELGKPNMSFRVLTEEGGSITAIDPSGGPFMSLGYHIPNLGHIVKIEHSKEYQGYVLEFGEEE